MNLWQVGIAVTGAGAFLAAGYLWPRFPRRFPRAGLTADLAHALVNGVLLDGPIAVIVRVSAAVLHDTAGDTGLRLLAGRPLWQQAFVLIFVGDLLKWTLHYLHHRVPCLWRLHRLHHATVELDALSAVRSHPIEVLLNKVPFALLMVVVLGIDLRLILGYTVLDTLQGLWVHSNTHVQTRWLNYLFATQEFHHWHHAADREATDRNFGAFLSVWDWIFQTAYCPRDRSVVRFGMIGTPEPERYLQQLALPLNR